ncbi:MAG: sulfatase/phosphatase domain-containing protein, partial [Bryobacteraceae bacterium]
LFPTLCALTGVQTPDGVEGSSLASVIRGEKSSVRDYLFAVYKDVQRMVRDKRYKLIWYPKVDRFQLFDLENDPWELNDLSAKPEQSARVADLKRKMAELQDEFDDKISKPVG